MKRVLTAVLLVIAPASLAAQGLAWEGSLGLARGAYIFADPVTTWSLHTGLALTSGRVTLRASLPLLLQNSTLLTASATGGVPSGGSSSGAVADSGKQRAGGRTMMPARGPVEVPPSAYTGYRLAVGDPLLQGSVRLVEGPTSVGLSALAKAPVADTATYGTGRWDAGASLSLSRLLGRAALLAVDISWWHLGDLPSLDFRDPLQGSLSLAILRPGGWGASFTVAGSTRILQGYDPPLTVGAAVLRTGNPSWVLGAQAGLTETAPALAVNLGWRATLFSPR